MTKLPRPSHNRFLAKSFLLSLPFVLMTGCVVNAATGERQLILMSQDREIAMGREADEDIVGSLGLYPDSALQTYVQDLGQRMAARSERPELPWDFKIVDDPVVNAFALPGGFIYITRGILVHFNSEAELAAVLGHEIGHVTARHTAERLSRAQVLSVGLVATILLTPEKFQGLVGATALGTQILFLKYGRDDERQSDDLGFRYMRRVGYDPNAMPEVFGMLERVSSSSGGQRTPEWLSTHPNPTNRQERITHRIDSLPSDSVSGIVNRDPFLSQLAGITYGEDPRQGFFEESVFFHPTLRFQMSFPEEWRKQNQRDAVIGANSDQSSIIQLTIVEPDTPEQAATEFIEQDNIEGLVSPRQNINGLSAWNVNFSLTRSADTLKGVAAFIAHDGRVFRLLGAAEPPAWDATRELMIETINSFSELSDPARLNVQPNRIELVTLSTPMSFQDFLDRFPSAVEDEEIALLNGFSPDDELEAGNILKRVVSVKAAAESNRRGSTRRRSREFGASPRHF